MRKYPYDYTLSRENSATIFKRACSKISDAMATLNETPLLTDVDGTTIQAYEGEDGRRIVVYDDYDVGAVYVLSDFEIQKQLEELIAR